MLHKDRRLHLQRCHASGTDRRRPHRRMGNVSRRPESSPVRFCGVRGKNRRDNDRPHEASDQLRLHPGPADGRFHLERRKEALPNPTSSLDISESSLDSTQLQRLHNILKGEDINKLPGVCTAGVPDYSVLVWILQDEN